MPSSSQSTWFHYCITYFAPLPFADLLGKLGGERERWGSQLMALSAELDNLPIAALITSAFITYLPAQPEDVRSNLMEQWTK